MRVAGQLDHDAVMALIKRLSHLPDRDGCLVLDFRGVSFLGFAGVALVEAVAEQVRAVGGELEVWGVSDPRLRALQQSGDLRALRVSDGETAAAATRERNQRVLREALTAALRATGAPMGNAQLLDPASGDLRIAVQRGFHQPFLSYFRRVSAVGHGSSCGAAAQQQRPVFVEDIRTSPLFVGTTALEVLQDAGVQAVASLPVITPGGELAGMISIHCARSTLWTPEVRDELRHVGHAAGQLAREQARLCPPECART